MCFSAPASFAAGTALLTISAIAFSLSKNTAQRVLSIVPLIFSVQQFSEGVLWLSLTDTAWAHWRNITMYVFLFFAQVVWPVFVPLTILLFEKEPVRKKILRVLSGVGIFIALYLSYCLLVYDVQVTVDNHHIRYYLDFPMHNGWYSGIPYVIAAVISPFVSGTKSLRFLGLILLTSYLFSWIWYHDYIISVWCFFAAVFSIVVLVIIRQMRKADAAQKSRP
jgi:hypothetical protein